jgi:prolyl-tRNA synthetase
MYDYNPRETFENKVCSKCDGDKKVCEISGCYDECYKEYLEKIVEQMLEEKAMVEQVKKEAMKEFAKKLFAHLEGYENNEYLINVFNDVGEEYGIEI